MPRQRIITPRSARHAAWLLLLLILLAAAVNVPFALSRLHADPLPLAPPVFFTLQDLDLAYERPNLAYEWPSSTPHSTPWPPPDSWDEERAFGYRYVNAITMPPPHQDRNGFQMEVVFLGWPLPVLEDKQLWWDWDDPKLKGPENDPPLTILWPGLILNPLIVGSAAWVILITLTLGPIILKRWHRRRHHRCLACGYPVGESPVCTECGDAIDPR